MVLKEQELYEKNMLGKGEFIFLHLFWRLNLNYMGNLSTTLKA